ncbi:carbamoyltransferase HypF [Serratia fonticola]|uniref:carbamoyltransferase HypF n=1 Tax=Serratia fonticola TaxID=47917 RepID=UPI00217BE58F|nr:carbamoyltransferase HypF [Serratia fonticola]CAI0877980.1 Carbamoyltransferase hypF [Serratia fonticola]CAI0911373.1 Carbamoyltransferase hypF [Serratia fonticola]
MNTGAFLLSITGMVQGVGMRPFLYKLATTRNLRGWVLNSSSGVELAVACDKFVLNTLIHEIKVGLPSLARIDSIQAKEINPYIIKNEGFEIIQSQDNIRKVKIVSDMAVCQQCAEEYDDPKNRRYQHPFINCVDCGPRISIMKGLPYDRHHTTMSKFGLCGECTQEYHNPLSRRYHAQPVSCKKCGPKLKLNENDGLSYHEIIQHSAQCIMQGKIVCLKGISGYHYLVNALDTNAVKTLRTRKKRNSKPFALLFKNIESIKKYLNPTPMQLEEIEKQYRPIVLINKKNNKFLPEIIAPRLTSIGAMLPSWPLHNELFRALETDVLVMTSANKSGFPLASHDGDVLGDNTLHDMLVTHDREIVIPADDSLVNIFTCEAKDFRILIRKGRGLSPYYVDGQLSQSGTMALGAFQKNTLALQIPGAILISGHLGDSRPGNHEYIKKHITNYIGLYDLETTEVVIDAHPRALNFMPGKEPTRVQHHHAHLVSCMVENGLDEPCIGAIFDGTGFGVDNNIWGGEFLFGDSTNFHKVGGLKVFSMPSGENAFRDIYKIAVCILCQAGTISDSDIRSFLAEREFLQDRINMYSFISSRKDMKVKTSSAGRLLDALAAIAGIPANIEYEGQAPLELEAVLSGSFIMVKPVEFEIEKNGNHFEIDFYKLVRFIFEKRNVLSIKYKAKIIYSTFVAYLVAGARMSRELTGCNRIVLSGGVFQNSFLLGNSYHKLCNEGFEVYMHNNIPCNDAGISIGQLIISNKVRYEKN